MNIPMDLADVAGRVKEKWRRFREYNFGTLKDDALMTFYDLAQEYETMENFYRVSVWVVKEFFGLGCRLYLFCSEGRLELVPVPGFAVGPDDRLQLFDCGRTVFVHGNTGWRGLKVAHY